MSPHRRARFIMKPPLVLKRFINTQKCFSLGIFITLFMCTTELVGSPSWLKALPVRILEVPGLPLPSNFHFLSALVCIFLWSVNQFHRNARFPHRSRNDFFNLLHLVEKTVKGTNSILGGAIFVLAIFYLATGSIGALAAIAWASLVVLQQSLILLFLLKLACSTSWNVEYMKP